MLRGISTRKLLIGALAFPLVALAILIGVIVTFTSETPAVEANVWPQTVDLAEALHIEAVLSAQADAAEGEGSASDLADQRIRTDAALETWAGAGGDTGQLQVQLDAARVPDEDRAATEGEELLSIAETIRMAADETSPSVRSVSALVFAAQADAGVAIEGSPVATLTTASRPQRSRIEGMAAVSNSLIEAATPVASNSLESVLASTEEVRTALADGESLTIGQWTDAHVERQRAIAEVARGYALLGAPTVAEADDLPSAPLTVVAALGIATLLGLGALVLTRLNAGTDELAEQMLTFAKRTVPATLSADHSSSAKLADKVAPVAIAGDLEPVGAAFNEIQQSTAYVLDRERADHRFTTDRVFRSLADRNRTVVGDQRRVIDELRSGESDIARLEQIAQLDAGMRRMQRDVVSLDALGGDATSPREEDRSLSELLSLANRDTRGSERVRMLTVDDVLVDAGSVADVSHIVTELLENALHSSPPESIVEVMGHHTDKGSLVVSIADEGFGMDAEEMAGLNEVLAGSGTLKPETAGTLGVVAISSIAARSGIGVRFTDSPASGVTALITLPAEAVRELPADRPRATIDAPNLRLVGNDEPPEQTAVDRTDGAKEAPTGLEHREEATKATAGEPESTDDDLALATFDRELPVAEYEYDLDTPAPQTESTLVDDGGHDFGLGEDPEDIPLSQVDYDESPFAAELDQDLSEPSGAAALGVQPAKPPLPLHALGPKKRRASTEQTAEEEHVAVPRPLEESDVVSPGPAFADNDPVSPSQEAPFVPEAEPEPEPADAAPGSETAAEPSVESSPVSTGSYAALDSLLAKLPENDDTLDAQEQVVKPAVARRIPTNSSSTLPSDLAGGSHKPRSAKAPKTPEEVQAMLSKYRSGRGGEDAD